MFFFWGGESRAQPFFQVLKLACPRVAGKMVGGGFFKDMEYTWGRQPKDIGHRKSTFLLILLPGKITKEFLFTWIHGILERNFPDPKPPFGVTQPAGNFPSCYCIQLTLFWKLASHTTPMSNLPQKVSQQSSRALTWSKWYEELKNICEHVFLGI